MDSNQLTWSDFEKVVIRVGTVIDVLDFPEAHRPAYRLFIDFGAPIGILKTSAQITKLYRKEALIGKQLVAVVNFPEKQIANLKSQCLVLGAVNGDEVTLLQPMSKVKNGLKIS
jgi:tRNA-binding protein|tara:strand:- start:2882 stop:3223 length:342 start_codon:yes stop_codon:yes gene_type:complete